MKLRLTSTIRVHRDGTREYGNADAALLCTADQRNQLGGERMYEVPPKCPQSLYVLRL